MPCVLIQLWNMIFQVSTISTTCICLLSYNFHIQIQFSNLIVNIILIYKVICFHSLKSFCKRRATLRNLTLRSDTLLVVSNRSLQVLYRLVCAGSAGLQNWSILNFKPSSHLKSNTSLLYPTYSDSCNRIGFK